MKRKIAKIALFSMVAVMLLLGCKDAFHDPGWDPNSATYEQDGLSHTVTFSANGGSGTAPSSMRGESGASITLPYPGGLSRGNNYSFGGWNTNSTGTGITFSAGSPFTVPNQDITLYAKWEAAPTSSGGGGSGGGSTAPANPGSGDDANFSYQDVSGGVEITGYYGSEKSVTIPAQLGGKAVVSIGRGAFQGKQLTNVIIPNSATTIGQSAFANNQLTSVTIPNSVAAIGQTAFSENKLTSANIPNSVTTIGEGAFQHNQLTSITIPNSITTIVANAFSNNQLTSVSIGNGVTTIGMGAFANNQLTSITIGNSVTTIGVYAFSNNQLTSVIIPNNVTNIMDGAFLNNLVTSVTIGANVSLGTIIFDSGNTFNEAYEANSRSAGTYVRPTVNHVWSKL